MNNMTVIISALMLISSSQAALSSPPHRHGPPPEALKACEDQVEGAEVNFKSRRGDTIDATCRLMKERLLAVPKHRYKHKKRDAE